MTPEEKAKELIEAFRPHADWNNEYGSSEEQANVKHAKQCAIICVEQIIGELNELRKPEYTTFIIEYNDPDEPGDPIKIMDGYEKINYWEEVINHIKNS